MQIDANTYRNLALHRPAYQSSAYDYNLTAQLITDGVKDHDIGWVLSTSTSDRGVLPKNEREVFLDGNVVSAVTVGGEPAWVEFDIDGAAPPELDRIDLYIAKARSAPVTNTRQTGTTASQAPTTMSPGKSSSQRVRSGLGPR